MLKDLQPSASQQIELHHVNVHNYEAIISLRMRESI